MGNSSAPGLVQEGLVNPIVPGMDHPLFAPLLKEFMDVFFNSVFLPEMYVTHDIGLIDPTS